MTTNVCVECGEPFLSKRKAKYCCQSCRSKAYYREHPDKCKNLTKDWEKRNPERARKRKSEYNKRQQELKKT